MASIYIKRKLTVPLRKKKSNTIVLCRNFSIINFHKFIFISLKITFRYTTIIDISQRKAKLLLKI